MLDCKEGQREKLQQSVEISLNRITREMSSAGIENDPRQ